MNEDLTTLSVSQLRDALAEAEQHKALATARAKAVGDELTRRLADECRRRFEAAGKISGDLIFEDAHGLKYKASIPKTVSWDNAKLQAVAGSMPWEIAQRVFDISFKVPEATFKALTDPELIAKLEDARTTKYGDITIKPI